jgi:hypothetical protein
MFAHAADGSEPQTSALRISVWVRIALTPAPFVVAPEGLGLVAKRPGAGVVGGAVIGHRRGDLHRQAGLAIAAAIRSRQSEWISPER